MSSDAPSPIRPPRRVRAQPPFAMPFRIVWWVGALLPAITVGLDFAGLLKSTDFPLLTPINTFFASVLVCSVASYSQRRDITAVLMDMLLVMLLALVQITLIARLAARMAGSPGLIL